MSSTFGNYKIAYSGMRVNQAALSVVSNNLSNVNTTGYSRQRISSVEENTVLTGGQSLGMGSNVQEIARARDELLDQTYRRQNAKTGYWSVKSGDLEYMQKILTEYEADDGTSTDGLQQMLENFFDSWSELATDSSSLSSRQVVTDSAVSLIDTLTQIDGQLQQLQQDACDRVQEAVDTLNDLAQQVADLNSQIKAAELGGGEASYLRDQRDSLLDQMSTYANINVQEHSNGVLQVTIGGVNLVNGDRTKELAVTGDGSTTDPLKVQWSGLNQAADITSGTVAAYLEEAQQTDLAAIDNATDIPYAFSTGTLSDINTMRQALNDLICTLAVAINSLHSSGTDLNGNAGEDFFTAVDSSQPLSISNIQVNPALLAEPAKVVAAAGADSGDNTIANQIYELTGDDLFKFNGAAVDVNTFYESFIGWLGTAGDDANSSYDTQTTLVDQVDSQRQTISAVSMDEEMSNMIMYQNAYNASARVLSTIDSLIGDLMDDLGG
ncbi:MAG TPA: flagellar hook-associated protein FlgK [Methylomusa anaerophila]|uniref:Flagellar hook-associated protein 1 n=1 Tax=Methylomusa anaerophila TaxID=1930071 RepID=A0A348AH57_9FIRM|nr:flagellar hook-associated protein FlgK [Methylomusa anaerophila]BBB90405.1 flagellar hook-associated protein 1 [Methylomusa anaerophila]HML90380.1 flagellar hook-associated protein FlgK [Methylomusa anaerophila]